MKKLRQLEAKIFADVMCEAGDLLQTSPAERKALGAGAGLVFATATALSAVAAPAQQGGKRWDQALGEMMNKIYLAILGVSTGVAVVFAAINLVKYMTATDPQSALMAKKSAIRVLIAWVLLNSLGAVVSLFSSITTGYDTVNNWSTDQLTKKP